VAGMVAECSDDKKKPKQVRKQLQLEHASSASHGAKLVKLADKYDNVSDLLLNPPSSWSESEVAGYAVWCLAVFRRLQGINTHLDAKFQRLFEQFGFWTMSE